jgi:hypothetical protein
VNQILPDCASGKKLILLNPTFYGHSIGNKSYPSMAVALETYVWERCKINILDGLLLQLKEKGGATREVFK